MKKECYMKTGNSSDFDSWKCGKGKAFAHIPTNIMILIKTNSSISYKGK